MTGFEIYHISSFYSNCHSNAMKRTQRKMFRSLSFGMILGEISTTAILHNVLLFVSAMATYRSSGPGSSICGREYHHPDPESCVNYLVVRTDCSSSPQVTVQRRQCPLGLLFHRLSKTCESPWIADCRVSHPVSPSVPTLSLYSTIKNNRVLPTADITSERNSVDSKSSTGSYVGASIEVLETNTDFRTLDTNHIDQSGFTVSPLVSVSDQAGTVNRKEVTTKGSDVTSIVSFANENMSQMKSTAIIALKSHPTEATIHLNDSVATVGLLLTAGTSSADSTLDIGTARASEYSVRPTTDQDETTYDTVLRTQFNLQSTTTTTKSSRATMLKENSSRAVTISTVPAESSAAAEFRSKERETILTSQHLDVNIYSTTAVPEYSQEKTTENFPVSVKSGSVEITTSMRTRNASRDATTAAREKTTGVEEYPRSPAAAETFTLTITTIDNATVAVDENSSLVLLE